MRNNKIEEYKKSLKLTNQQREIVIGLLLGDGHLETWNGGKTYRLKIEHAIKQKEYTEWLYSIFQEWVRTPPQEKKKLNPSGNTTKNIWFQTYSHSSLRFYAQQFYCKGIKRVPDRIDKWLKPLSMAVWFMDDGSYKSKDHRALIINTQGFIKDDIILLQKVMMSYNIETQIRKQVDGLQILITEPSASRFAEIVKPYLRKEFWYKLGKIGLTQLPKE